MMRRTMPEIAARFIRDCRGATAIEYALIAALVALVIIPSLIGVRDALIAVPIGEATKALKNASK